MKQTEVILHFFTNFSKQMLNSRPRNFQLRKKSPLINKTVIITDAGTLGIQKASCQGIYPLATSGSPFHKTM